MEGRSGGIQGLGLGLGLGLGCYHTEHLSSSPIRSTAAVMGSRASIAPLGFRSSPRAARGWQCPDSKTHFGASFLRGAGRTHELGPAFTPHTKFVGAYIDYIRNLWVRI